MLSVAKFLKLVLITIVTVYPVIGLAGEECGELNYITLTEVYKPNNGVVDVADSKLFYADCEGLIIYRESNIKDSLEYRVIKTSSSHVKKEIFCELIGGEIVSNLDFWSEKYVFTGFYIDLYQEKDGVQNNYLYQVMGDVSKVDMLSGRTVPKRVLDFYTMALQYDSGKSKEWVPEVVEVSTFFINDELTSKLEMNHEYVEWRKDWPKLRAMLPTKKPGRDYVSLSKNPELSSFYKEIALKQVILYEGKFLGIALKPLFPRELHYLQAVTRP